MGNQSKRCKSQNPVLANNNLTGSEKTLTLVVRLSGKQLVRFFFKSEGNPVILIIISRSDIVLKEAIITQ